MAFSISKMKEDNLLVKEMAASENLAYTNIICTGKTGTLTEGNMEVKEYTIGGQSFKFVPEDCNLLIGKHGEIIKSCIVLNNDAKIEMCYDHIRKSAIYQPTGNKTEAAMLNFLYANNVEAHTLLSER